MIKLASLKCMISTSCLELSLYRVLRLCKTAFHPHISSKECGGRGEVKVHRDSEIVQKKMTRESCREKLQSGSCDSGIVRLRGKCSGLVLQRAV